MQVARPLTGVAARIDGCGWWRVYQALIMPLCRPALAAVAIFAFVGSWQEFLTPLVYLNRQNLYTVALGIQLFNGQYQSYYNIMMAAALHALLPIVVIFLLAQRYFIQGVVLTGIKG
jgi:multiple sugar transport system permease protein